MKTYKTTTIKSLCYESKLVIEVPHQRPASLYTTNMKANDFISDNSNVRFKDSFGDLSHSFICKNLSDLEYAYNNSIGHQSYLRKKLIKKWANEYLTGAQYLSIFGERKSNDNN
jgi:hypothetical protein